MDIVHNDGTKAKKSPCEYLYKWYLRNREQERDKHGHKYILEIASNEKKE